MVADTPFFSLSDQLCLEPIEERSEKRSVASSSTSKPVDPEDDSDQEDDDLGKFEQD